VVGKISQNKAAKSAPALFREMRSLNGAGVTENYNSCGCWTNIDLLFNNI